MFGLWMVLLLTVNISRPRRNGRHFPYDIFKCILLNENVWIKIKISLSFAPKGLINNIPSLVQIMVPHRRGDKPLSEPMMINLLTHICVVRPQWVNHIANNQQILATVLMDTSVRWPLRGRQSRQTYICVSKLCYHCFRKWTDACSKPPSEPILASLLTGSSGTNFSEIGIIIQQFSYKKGKMKMLFAKSVNCYTHARTNRHDE